MDIVKIIDPALCAVNITANSKAEFLDFCATAAAQSTMAPVDKATLLRALTQREQEGSTGFGNEIAIPHARVEQLQGFILFIVTSRKGIPFEAQDKKRVKLFFVLLGPAEKVNEHLKILAFISRTLGRTEVKGEILNATTPQAQVEAFLRHADPEVIAPAPQQSGTMSLLVLILYNENYLEDILEIFLEHGIEGATILDSTGMGQYISNAPLFGNFIGCMHQNKHHSKTILTMVSKPHVKTIVRAVENTIGDIAKDQSATILSVDLATHKGSMNIV